MATKRSNEKDQQQDKDLAAKSAQGSPTSKDDKSESTDKLGNPEMQDVKQPDEKDKKFVRPMGTRPPRDEDARMPTQTTVQKDRDTQVEHDPDEDTSKEVNAGGEGAQSLTNDENLVLEEDKDRVDYPSEEYDQQADLEPVAGPDTLQPQQTMVFQRNDTDGDTFIPSPPLAAVTHMTARGDSDALTGHFVDVTGGEYEGRYGVLDYIATVDKHGTPLTGVVVTRDNDAMNIVVDYKDLVRAEPGRR